MEENKPQQTSQNAGVSKEGGWKYATFALVVVLVAVVAYMIGSNGGTTGQAIVNPDSGNVPTQPVEVSEDDDAVLGDKDAPVTIIEFSDYQCPFCGRFWSDTLPQIQSQYIDTGKVKLVYRDFPLSSIHPQAQGAAEAAECVRDAAKGDDEAYFKYHDKIFENQATLSANNLKAWATEMGYDIDSCLDSGKFKSEVQADLREGSAAGVQGTPSFFINGVQVSGAQPFSAFQQVIEAAL